MSRKTKVIGKDKLKEKASKTKLEEPKSTSIEPDESETQFDFGGLPKRDLKKNLGCG